MKRFPTAVLGASFLIGLAVACSPRTGTGAAKAADTGAPVNTAADTPSPGISASPASAAAPAPVVEPAALAALDKMGGYLRSLKSFQVDATTTADTVLESGQLVQMNGKVSYRVRKPDAFVIVNNTDRKNRTLYYDGKTFTLYAPRMKFYAQADAPPTIPEAVAVMEDKYDLELPLADLFYWGTDQAPTTDITSGIEVGPANVDGVICSQYAFRQGDTDWQVFIQTGDKPLPRRIVITSLSDDARPQFTATLTWKEKATFAPAIFTFKPGPDARRIKISEEQG